MLVKIWDQWNSHTFLVGVWGGVKTEAVWICFKVNYCYTQEQDVTQKHYIEWKKPEAKQKKTHCIYELHLNEVQG